MRVIIRKYLLLSILIIAGLTAIAASAEAETIADKARAISWTENNIDAIKRIFADTLTVNEFLLALLPDADPQPKVGDFQLVDLHRDGQLELVVTAAFSRAFYNHLYIVSRDGDQFQTAELFTGGPVIADLKSSIVDLNGDGQKQLLLPRGLAPYGGAKPIPIITDVYEWNGRQFEAADSSYITYYRDTVLPRLHTALDKVEKGKEAKGPKTTRLLREKYLKEIEAVTTIIGQ